MRWLPLALASAGFAVYIANFSSYQRTYGAIGAALVFLVWLWLSNWALLVRGEFDVKLERMRQLHSGMDAESRVHVPMRQTGTLAAPARCRIRDVVEAREIKDRARQAGTKTSGRRSG